VKDEREQQYGDDYILLAAHAILDEYFLNRNVQSYLVDAISLLEYGLEKSKFNYQFKILLIRLYVELGMTILFF
jgi:N-terminal acetyltransferase B complex non-catalytic subunit